MKSPQRILIKILRFAFVFVLITSWIFSPFANVSFRIADYEISLIPPLQGAHAGTTKSTYTTPGNNSPFVVPTGVTSITVKAWGAGGGGGAGGSAGRGGNGGGAGFAQGTISVTPGESLTVHVGGTGGGGSARTNSGDGGGGGGRSAVLRSSTPLIVAAGGGGGGGGDNSSSTQGGNGGPGGGTTGTSGSASGSAGGGGGGSNFPFAEGGGAGGTGGSNAGSAGSSGAGGAGADGDNTTPLTDGSTNNGGTTNGGDGGQGDIDAGFAGGGGGGLGDYGGGGGSDSASANAGGGGGGGGASYITGTGTQNTAGSGTSAGNNGDPDYAGNAGVGGSQGLIGGAGSSGNNGRIVISYNSPPSINVDEPDGTNDTVTQGDNYTIQYDLSDSDSVVTADFYYDTNSSGLDGTAIAGCQDKAEGTNQTCAWDTTGVTPGTYYVYGITSDGTTEVSDYSSGQVTILAADISISGTLYSDEGKTAVASGKMIKLYMATSSTSVATSTTSDGSGNFSFAGFSEFSTVGMPIALWVDGDSSFRASAVTVASSTSNDITDLDLYQNRVIIKHESESATSTTISKLALFDGDNDSDIQFLVDGSNNLSIKAGQMLYIWPGTHFDTSIESGGTVTMYGGVPGTPDGDITLDRGFHPASPATATSSIFTIGSGVSIAGSWFASSTSIFNHNSQTVTFTATTTGNSIYASSTPFYNLTFDGVDGTNGGWTFREMASTTNNFTITDGTVVAPSWLSITGDFTNNGTFSAGTGTSTFNGTAAQTISGTLTGSSALANVEVDNSFADWFHAGWLYRKKITLKQASTTLTNFPVLVSLSDTDLSSNAQIDGDDILFTSSDGTTRLFHEVENYASGGLTAWVIIPTLSSAATNDIYMYYGNAATSSEETSASVWDSNYIGVWHMSETPTTVNCGVDKNVCDSTLNGYHATSSGMVAGDQQAGKINGGINFDGSDAYLSTLNTVSVRGTTQYTVSAWVNTTVLDSTRRTIFEEETNVSGQSRYKFGLNTTNQFRFAGRDVDGSAFQTWIEPAVSLSTDTWYYVSAVFNSDTDIHRMAINGNEYTNTLAASAESDTMPANASTFGRRPVSLTELWSGKIDEYRISNTARSSDWIAIEHDNQSATSTFYTAIGSEETDSGGTGITFSNSASTTNFMIMDGGVKAPPYLYISGNFDNQANFDANSGTTTFNGTSQQYISGFATGTNAFAGLEVLNTTASTTFTAAASSTGMMTASAGARLEFKAGATTTVQNISLNGSGGNDIYLHPSTPAEEGGWDLSNASNDNITYDITGQGGTGTVSTGIAFKSDGTKMYQLDAGTDSVYQYSLSTAWDISTLSYDSVSHSVTTQDTNPTDIAFKSDGTKMYIIGLTGDKVYEYPLSSAWNLSTASFNNASTSIFSQDGTGQGLAFKSDGTKMYMVGTSNDRVHQYSLNSAWDITSASSDDVSLLVSGEDGSPQGIAFKSDGTKLFMVGALNDEVHQYSLSSAWDLSTASYDEILLDVNPPESEPWGLAFKPDGTKLFLLGQIGNDTVYQYSLTGLRWGFEVPGGRSVSYVNVKDSNACYTSGNDITATNSTDGGNNNCWDITAPVAAGTLTIADHDAGQESNKFNTSILTDEEFFRFTLTPASEAITTTLIFSLSAFGISQSDITNAQLFPDYNGDGNINGDDPEDPVGGSGTVSIVGNTGTITFSGFSTSTAMNYILQADVTDINPGDEVSIGLNKAKITSTGVSSGQSITPSGTVLLAVHSRSGGGSVGGGGKTGDTSTAQGTQTGGGGGGGESLGDDNDNKAPGSSGTPSNFWSSGGNGIVSDNSYASETTDDEGLNFNNFGFTVPSGDTINGIEIKIEASCVTTCGSIDVALSWDNDGTNSTTTAKNTGTLTTTDTIYTLGGSTDTWGRSWSASEFTDANFSVEVIAQPSGANAVQIDAITARVYHQSEGGEGGGGGRSYHFPPFLFAVVPIHDIKYANNISNEFLLSKNQN